MKWPYLALSYAIAAAFMAGAVWLTWEWHWAIRVPLLAYLALCSLLFPLARLPADLVVYTTAAWSPIELTGLLAWIPLALLYVVAWVLGVVFAPVGALMHFAGKRRATGTGP
jgi:hypothetical protein